MLVRTLEEHISSGKAIFVSPDCALVGAHLAAAGAARMRASWPACQPASPPARLPACQHYSAMHCHASAGRPSQKASGAYAPTCHWLFTLPCYPPPPRPFPCLFSCPQRMRFENHVAELAAKTGVDISVKAIGDEWKKFKLRACCM